MPLLSATLSSIRTPAGWSRLLIGVWLLGMAGCSWARPSTRIRDDLHIACDGSLVAATPRNVANDRARELTARLNEHLGAKDPKIRPVTAQIEEDPSRVVWVPPRSPAWYDDSSSLPDHPQPVPENAAYQHRWRWWRMTVTVFFSQGDKLPLEDLDPWIKDHMKPHLQVGGEVKVCFQAIGGGDTSMRREEWVEHLSAMLVQVVRSFYENKTDQRLVKVRIIDESSPADLRSPDGRNWLLSRCRVEVRLPATTAGQAIPDQALMSSEMEGMMKGFMVPNAKPSIRFIQKERLDWLREVETALQAKARAGMENQEEAQQLKLRVIDGSPVDLRSPDRKTWLMDRCVVQVTLSVGPEQREDLEKKLRSLIEEASKEFLVTKTQPQISFDWQAPLPRP